MGLSIFKRGFIRQGLIIGVLLCSGSLRSVYSQSGESVKPIRLGNQNYISAFASPPEEIRTVRIPSDSIRYTILICTTTSATTDPVLSDYGKTLIIPMGELYRYIFSAYSSLEKAQQDLQWIRKLYPDAYIRRYENGKLGQAINLNIDYIE